MIGAKPKSIAAQVRIRCIIALGALSMMLLLPSGALRAAELLMLEQSGCVWCERWHAEIGPIYPKTSEAEIAPLRRVDIDEKWPEDLANIEPDHFTPTFVLVENGIEIDRLRGYAGEEFFWFLIDEMLAKLPAEAKPEDRMTMIEPIPDKQSN